MPQGTIKKKTDKGFGFINTETGKDMFFHSTNVEAPGYEALREGQKVSYDGGGLDRRDREPRTSGRSDSVAFQRTRKPTNLVGFFVSDVGTHPYENAVDQANLLVIAMAERCQRIIQDKTEDVRFGLPESLRPDHLDGCVSDR